MPSSSLRSAHFSMPRDSKRDICQTSLMSLRMYLPLADVPQQSGCGSCWRLCWALHNFRQDAPGRDHRTHWASCPPMPASTMAVGFFPPSVLLHLSCHRLIYPVNVKGPSIPCKPLGAGQSETWEMLLLLSKSEGHSERNGVSPRAEICVVGTGERDRSHLAGIRTGPRRRHCWRAWADGGISTYRGKEGEAFSMHRVPILCWG